MGYYTRYELNTKPELSPEQEKEISQELKKLLYHDEDLEVEDFQDVLSEEMKWYEHQQDMVKISSKYPDILFELTGEGEESEDLWIEYHKNGKFYYERARIIYDEFNEEKLNNS